MKVKSRVTLGDAGEGEAIGYFVWGLPCLGRLSGLAEDDVDWRCVGWMRTSLIRHKARAGGNKSEEGAVAGSNQVTWFPVAELLLA